MSCALNISELLQATGGKALSAVNKEFKGVGTDSRKDLTGQLFIPLKGEQFDAHDFIDKAVEQGAAMVLTHKELPNIDDIKQKVSVIQVPDTLSALQRLANFWRKQLNGRVIAITGSNGKTTTKNFANTILSMRFKTYASPGSYNNHWGVPLSLLGASLNDEAIILEMGMNHAGEIKYLCEIAEPRTVVVTMVGSSHIGNFNSIEEIAAAKEEIYDACPRAVQIFNGDNGYTMEMFKRASKSRPIENLKVFSSFSGGAEVGLKATNMDLNGLKVEGHIAGVQGEAQVKVFGRQNVTNLMAAASIALVMGMAPEDIWAAMSTCETGWGRNQLIQLKNGAQVLFDAYNANPDSTGMMIKNLFEIPAPKQKIVVFGEMLELGDESEKAHENIAEMVGNTDVDVIWFIGPSKDAFEAGLKRSMFQKSYFLSSTYEQTLAEKVGSMLHSQDIVVIKGSRGMKLEQVLKAWEPVDF